MQKKRKEEECEHKWIEDEMFASGVVMMVSSIGGENPLDLGQETRVQCEKCGAADYVPKDYMNRIKIDPTL